MGGLLGSYAIHCRGAAFMHVAFRAFLLASALSVASAASAAPLPVAPILTTPEAKDLRSFARPQVARVTHVDLDLTAGSNH